MYLQSKSIQADKISSEISYSKGSVTIKASNININWNSYTKREKFIALKQVYEQILGHYISRNLQEVLQFTFLNILLIY
jgi:hypothetical protein